MSEQAVPQEVNQPQTQEPQAVKDPLADSFARITKQEKHIAEQRKQMEEARKAFENDKKEVDSYRSLKGKNPFEILEHFGITYDQLLEADKAKQDPYYQIKKELKQEVDSVRSELSRKEKELEDKRRAEGETQLRFEIAKTVKAEGYDVIELLGAEDAVREYMEEMYDATQQIPDIKEACKAITESIVTKYKTIKDSKWLKEPEPVKEEVEAKKQKPAETLSNKMTQSVVHQDRPMTEQERLKAAAKVMESFTQKK